MLRSSWIITCQNMRQFFVVIALMQSLSEVIILVIIQIIKLKQKIEM